MPLALNTPKALPLFSALRPEDSATLVRNSRTRSWERGKFLFMHGDTITHFYVICRGTIQIFRETPDGHEITSDMLIAGDTINAEEIITKQTIHAMNARAVDDALILEIPVAWMRENLSSFDHIAAHLMAGLSERLHNAQMEAEHQSTMSATQIVACYLQRLCVLYRFDPHGFELPYSKTLIASRLRIELETFSRTLQKLKEQGITVTGSHVSFTDMKKTGHFVCDACSMSEDCPSHLYLHTKLKKPPKYAL
jgi:CRP-like cAMP-binding protein